jgi:DNA sulfur modification protein DndE
MHWDVFAGELADYIVAVLAIRAAKDGIQLTKVEMALYFRSHLERGILQLQSTSSLTELCKRAIQPARKS